MHEDRAQLARRDAFVTVQELCAEVDLPDTGHGMAPCLQLLSGKMATVIKQQGSDVCHATAMACQLAILLISTERSAPLGSCT